MTSTGDRSLTSSTNAFITKDREWLSAFQEERLYVELIEESMKSSGSSICREKERRL
jgi:hypothetical protein